MTTKTTLDTAVDGTLDRQVEQSGDEAHKSVVLFYKYFVKTCPLLSRYPEHYISQLHLHQNQLCTRLKLKGRVLISVEGINGTVSAIDEMVLKEYMEAMEKFDLAKDCEAAVDVVTDSTDNDVEGRRLYADIDWKSSAVDGTCPFPDLKVSIVNEIVSTGGVVNVSDVATHGGQHLTPEQFHNVLRGKTESGREDLKKEVAVIDVRNTFEYDIGHFVNPKTQEAAMNPEMVAFSTFDATFCARNAADLQDKKVLMYCTGGIRCEKASVMLKKRGVTDVCQLEGGIHRYMETFGSGGFFRGKNFVFDQRVALAPPLVSASDKVASEVVDMTNGKAASESENVVGKCVECASPFDEISGSRICTVCRDLVLVCPKCQSQLREYHCRRHSAWKHCYFTFLEIYMIAELEDQKEELVKIREALTPPSSKKNVRRTLMHQITKISDRIKRLQSGEEVVNRTAPRRCRTCFETEQVCDGLCFGFWKQSHPDQTNEGEKRKTCGRSSQDEVDFTARSEEAIPIQLGDVVEPGLRWNTMRLGSKTYKNGKLKRGTVVDIKPWGSGGEGSDCVAVRWDSEHSQPDLRNQPQIYRWGVRALNGERIYDVQKVEYTIG